MPLTAREFDAAHLPRPPGRPGRLASSEILAGVWDDAFEGDPNVVEVYVARLRRKLDGAGRPAPIETVRGMGYRLEAVTATRRPPGRDRQPAVPGHRTGRPGRARGAAAPRAPA